MSDSPARLFVVKDNNGKVESHISLQWSTAPNVGMSQTLGRPSYDKVIKGTVLAPSQMKSQPILILVRIDEQGRRREMSPHYNTYAEQVAQFERSETGGNLAGTPVEEWAMIDAAFAQTLKALKVFTVEQLADASDTTLQHIGQGARMWKDKAANWLAAAKDGAHAGRMTEENARLQRDNEALKKQVADLAARFDAIEKQQGRGKAA